jgi:hypothetical protein
MLCWGVTNRLSGGLRLFFYEYDDVDLYDVIEDANFLSQVFEIDIYVLESSPRHYHTVSFDILSFEKVDQIQNWTSMRGDYVNGKDAVIDGGRPHNTLRLGAKGRKAPPKFVKAIYAEKNPYLKSLGHFNAWKALCGLPSPRNPRKFVRVSYAMLSVYKTGIGVKKRWDRGDVFRIR